MDKILTIIIPTYNMEKYLRHCLDSLIVPNMDKVEVLVINDGSKDSSSAIGHEYQDKYPQTFRVIDKENGNYGSCVNRGLNEATGKYVKVLDADDSFDSKSFEEYINQLSYIDVDLVLNDTKVVNENDQETDYWRVNVKPEAIFDYFEAKLTVFMHAVAYRTSNLRKINYWQSEGISHTDEEWIFWPMSTVKNAFYIPVPLYRYLIGRAGQTMDPKVMTKAYPQKLKVLRRMIEVWEKHHSEWSDCKTYLDGRISGLLYSLFEQSIITGSKAQKELFVQFEKDLKANCPVFYDYSNSFWYGKKFHIHYLKYWRKHNSAFPFNIYIHIKNFSTNNRH